MLSITTRARDELDSNVCLPVCLFTEKGEDEEEDADKFPSPKLVSYAWTLIYKSPEE